jgi:hypothetical protein
MNQIFVLAVSLMFLGGGFAAPVASAGTFHERQVRQRARIVAGLESGSLVHREARKLRREQLAIKNSKKRMVHNDGKLGPKERSRLNRMQNRSSLHIFRAKHNARRVNLRG